MTDNTTVHIRRVCKVSTGLGIVPGTAHWDTDDRYGARAYVRTDDGKRSAFQPVSMVERLIAADEPIPLHNYS